MLFAVLISVAWSNGVNLADGLDGLAAGFAAMVLGTYVFISFVQFHLPICRGRAGRLLPGAGPP